MTCRSVARMAARKAAIDVNVVRHILDDYKSVVAVDVKMQAPFSHCCCACTDCLPP